MQVHVGVEGGEGVRWVAVVRVAKGRRRRTRGRKLRKRGRKKEGEERGVSELVQVAEEGGENERWSGREGKRAERERERVDGREGETVCTRCRWWGGKEKKERERGGGRAGVGAGAGVCRGQ